MSAHLGVKKVLCKFLNIGVMNIH